MNVYTFHLYRNAGDRDASDVSVVTVANEAEALEQAWKLLKRSPDCVAVEVWSPTDLVCRLGETAGRSAGYLGRWERRRFA